MKSLKDICNVNIPNSLHSLLEGLLAGQQSTLAAGDEYAKVIDEFNAAKKLVIKQSGYEKIKAPKGFVYMQYVDISEIGELAKLKPIYHTLKIELLPPGGFYGRNHHISILLGDKLQRDSFVRLGLPLRIPNVTRTGSSAGDLIKRVVKPLFNDFDTFFEWLSTETDSSLFKR